MSYGAKVSSAVTSRYAIALIELAQEVGKMDNVEKDLNDLDTMIKGSDDLSFLVYSPSINAAQQKDALFAIVQKAKFQELTQNFLGVLIQNRRLYTVEAISKAVGDELSKRRGELSVDVQTAQDMTDKQIKDLQAALSKGLGRDVSLKVMVEPEILGGMIVTIGSHMIDDSVARKLERLKSAMGRQANENTNNLTKNTKKA